MRTYSEREIFNRGELKLFEQAKLIVQALPDYDQLERELRCHEVARVVGIKLGLQVCDGCFEAGAEHSWCRLPSRHILDPYCVGRLPPVQLVAVVTAMPCRYKERVVDTAIRADVVHWLLTQV